MKVSNDAFKNYYDNISVKPICGDYLTSIAVSKMNL